MSIVDPERNRAQEMRVAGSNDALAFLMSVVDDYELLAARILEDIRKHVSLPCYVIFSNIKNILCALACLYNPGRAYV